MIYSLYTEAQHDPVIDSYKVYVKVKILKAGVLKKKMVRWSKVAINSRHVKKTQAAVNHIILLEDFFIVNKICSLLPIILLRHNIPKSTACFAGL